MRNDSRNRIQSTILLKALASILAFLLLVSACSRKTQPPPSPELNNVHPVFQSFYLHLGGVEVLGEVISPAFQEGETEVQYTENAKMVFDINASEEEKFSTAPLGVEMDLVEPPSQPIEQDDDYFCEGHSVAPIFRHLYDQIGKKFVGCPISEIFYNPNRQRYEQFFENFGFYKLTNSNEVQLMPFGRVACGKPCEDYYNGRLSDDYSFDYGHPIHPVFHELVIELGTDFTGFALSEPYIGRDGKFQQIFGNVVLMAASSDDLGSVGVKPILREMNHPIEPPRENSDDPNSYFFETEDNLGYEIPIKMWEFIRSLGGSGISGPPITHIDIHNEQSYTQCFTNFCLTYNALAIPDRLFKPLPLGYAYKTLIPPEPKEDAPPTNQPPTPSPPRLLVMRDWMQFRSVTSLQNQSIGVIVLENYLPLLDAKLFINIIYPDGTMKRMDMPATNSDGVSTIILEPFDEAIGSLIHYDVCMELEDENVFCVGDSFPIWDNP